MEIQHNLNGASLNKKSDQPVSFLLKNRIGNYLMFSDKPLTRYCGFFFHKDMDMFGSVSNIQLENPGKLNCIVNNMHEVKRIFENNTETFFMPLKESAFVYELENESFAELLFDGREIYDNRVFGRYYNISEEGGKIIVRFSMRNESLDKEDYGFYIVISDGSGNIPLYQKTGKWIEREYSFDERRGSWPWKRDIFSGLKVRAKKLVISAAMDKKEAVIENDFVSEHLDKLKEEACNRVSSQSSITTQIKELNVAFANAQNSIRSLMTEAGSSKFITAGLPWFFHYWTRDTAISLKALIDLKEYWFAKDALVSLADLIAEDGRMFNRNSSEDRAADSAGFVFMRLYELLKQLNDENMLGKYFKEYELRLLMSKARAAIAGLNEHFTEDSLIRNEAIETWMDSKIKQDSRSGFRIEIQLLHIMVFRCMALIANTLGEKSLERYAKEKEKFLVTFVKRKFWNGKMLIDGIGDEVVRPNIFLAHYICPGLLEKQEWEMCFDTALDRLWMNWGIGGGLASVDKNSSFFVPTDLGENSESYHHGDVWFWINHIAAMALYEVNKAKYEKVIKSIISSSVNDLLWNGAVGHISEISSAEKYEPMGCWAQAWSASTFVEMMIKLFGRVRS